MPFSKMDPSCTIGFYSRNVQDYEKIRQELSKVGINTALKQDFFKITSPLPTFPNFYYYYYDSFCFVPWKYVASVMKVDH